MLLFFWFISIQYFFGLQVHFVWTWQRNLESPSTKPTEANMKAQMQRSETTQRLYLGQIKGKPDIELMQLFARPWQRFAFHFSSGGSTTSCYVESSFPLFHSSPSYKVTSCNCLSAGRSAGGLWGLHVSRFTLFSVTLISLHQDLTPLTGDHTLVTWFTGILFHTSGTIFAPLVKTAGVPVSMIFKGLV